MTAPTVSPAPTAPVAAPSQVVPTMPAKATPTPTPVFREENSVVGLNAMIQKIATKEGSAPAESFPVVDLKGIPDEAKVQAEQVIAEGTPPAESAEVAPEPTGEVVVDDGDVKLLAERDQEGRFKGKIDPSQKFDIVMKDPETGETRTYTKTLPEVLRMARDGVWGQKVKDEVQYYRAEVPKWEQGFKQLQQQHQSASQELTQLREAHEAMMALNRELLTAPDEVVIQRREQFAHESSPEQQLAKRVQALQAELAARDSFVQQQEQARQADAFISTRLAPVLAEAEQTLGGTEFAQRAVAGQIAIATQPLLVNGQLPPQAWPQVEAYLRGPFQEWVKAAAASLKPTVDPDSLRRTQVAAQAAVNSTGQFLRPVGTPSVSNAQPTTPPKNLNDAMSRIINRSRAG